jgi:hypothetical protein
MTPAGGWDFFVSYTKTDQEWAEWIAWILEENDYRVLIQAWDIVPGANWIHDMDAGTRKADRTMAVLSDAYLKSEYGMAESLAAWARDPTGSDRKLLVARIAPTDRKGLLAGVVDVDLFGLAEADARVVVLDMAESAVKGRRKPPVAPRFPGADRAVTTEPHWCRRPCTSESACAACVADWTLASPSTFFELGVRLAVSQWSVVQILEEKWFREKDEKRHYAKQIERMRAQLDPLLYRNKDDADIGSRMARQLISIRRRSGDPAGHWLRQAAAAALGPTEERLPHPSGHLVDQADALDHKNRARDNVAQALFYEIKEINQDQERAALERRLAAWLYLEYRVGAVRLDDADQRKRMWRELGEIIAGDLYNSTDMPTRPSPKRSPRG